MNLLHSTLDRVRDTWAPISHTSTFRQTGEITPEDFVRAGDYLVYKFPSWQWSDAEPSKRVSYLPAGKQFLVTKGVPCHRRIDQYAGDAGMGEAMVETGRGEKGGDDGWLRTGGNGGDGTHDKAAVSTEDVRTMDDDGKMEDKSVDEDEIPDMEDEEDDEEAIIRDTHTSSDNSPLRTYTLYITYTPYYRTPRIYLSGYSSVSQPLPPQQMMEDIVGDYKDKTVTLEDFPFFQSGVKMASVHPCRHASVMKVLLDRAEGALRRRREKIRNGTVKAGEAQGLEGLVDSTKNLKLGGKGKTKVKKEVGEDEWDIVSDEEERDDEVAIRVDQYLVVFLKFISSVTPTIEHDFTMGI